MGTTWMGEFAKTGSLEEVPDTIDQDSFFDSAQSTAVVDDEAYGVPWYVETRVLYYRKDIAEKAGITSPPATLGRVEGDGESDEGEGRSEVRHLPLPEQLAGVPALRLAERRRRHGGRRVHVRLARGRRGARVLQVVLRRGADRERRPRGLRHHARLHPGHASDVLQRPVAHRADRGHRRPGVRGQVGDGADAQEGDRDLVRRRQRPRGLQEQRQQGSRVEVRRVPLAARGAAEVVRRRSATCRQSSPPGRAARSRPTTSSASSASSSRTRRRRP